MGLGEAWRPPSAVLSWRSLVISVGFHQGSTWEDEDPQSRHAPALDGRGDKETTAARKHIIRRQQPVYSQCSQELYEIGGYQRMTVRSE